MRRLVLLGLLASCGGDALPPEAQRCLDALAEGRPEGREIVRLGPGDRAAVPAIVAMLEKDGRRAVQVPLLEALANIGDRSAEPAVRRAIASEDPLVSLAASAAHWRLTGAIRPGLEHLVDLALDAGPAGTALALIEAARPLPPEAAAEIRRRAALPGTDDASLRLRLLAAAGRDDTPATLDRIRTALDHPDARVRLDAAWALHRVAGASGEAARRLLAGIAAAPPLGRREGLDVLARVAREAPEACLPVLRDALADEDPVVRVVAAHAAVAMGAAAAPLRDALAAAAERDPSEDVRRTAAEALVTPRGS